MSGPAQKRMRDGTEPFVETELVIPRVADADP
jgi:hypothetical protein